MTESGRAPLAPVRDIALPGRPTLACRIHGEGESPVFFAHGYSMSLDCWDRVLPFLPARYRAVAYDLRGFGRSGRAARYGQEDHAADLVALMDALGIGSAVLVGHSLGANLAQMVATAHPARIRALVLANGRSMGLPPPDPVAGQVEARTAGYGSAADNRRVLESRMSAYFDAANLAPGDLDAFIARGAQADSEALRQTLRSLYSLPAIVAEAFASVRAPALAITGANDRMTPIEVCRPIEDVLPQAEIVVMPDAGHTPMWERPAEWSRIVFDFLDRSV
jgi:pimeloyl-ACP methyl ester carboxylesterase